MNKKIYFYPFLVALGIVAIISFVYVRNFADQQNGQVVFPASTTTDVETETKEIKESVDVFESEQNRYSVPPLADSIINESLGTRYGFRLLPELGGTGGDVWYLAEFQFDPPPLQLTKQFDQFGAVARALTSFSPDNHYLAFRTRWNLGTITFVFRLAIFDLETGETYIVKGPDELYNQLSQYESLYLESYEWIEGNKINMAWYPLIPERENDDLILFRTTLKQLWQYGLESGKYTFLREIEEMQ